MIGSALSNTVFWSFTCAYNFVRVTFNFCNQFQSNWSKALFVLNIKLGGRFLFYFIFVGSMLGNGYDQINKFVLYIHTHKKDIKHLLILGGMMSITQFNNEYYPLKTTIPDPINHSNSKQ